MSTYVIFAGTLVVLTGIAVILYGSRGSAAQASRQRSKWAGVAVCIAGAAIAIAGLGSAFLGA